MSLSKPSVGQKRKTLSLHDKLSVMQCIHTYTSFSIQPMLKAVFYLIYNTLFIANYCTFIDVLL
jgi:hypothetical protein